MYKTLEYHLDRKPMKNYKEYVADTFQDLPTAADGVELGDVGFFSDNGKIGFAMFLNNEWAKGN